MRVNLPRIALVCAIALFCALLWEQRVLERVVVLVRETRDNERARADARYARMWSERHA